MTNKEAMADMPLEEQVLFIKNHSDWFCYYCPYDFCDNDCDCDDCEEGIINWLDAEFGEDERIWLRGYFDVG